MKKIISEGPWLWYLPDEEGALIDKGFVFYRNMQGASYSPFEWPNLPNRLAKVESENDIIHFVEKYGVLGHQILLGEEKAGDRWFLGDQVNWFLLHAKTIKFALRLIYAIQSEKTDADLKQLIFSNTIKAPLRMFEERAKETDLTIPTHHFAIRGEDVFRSPIQAHTWEGHHRSIAIQIVSYLIAENTKGVCRRIGINSTFNKSLDRQKAQFVQQFHARTLIEAIWYQVGDVALNIQGKVIRNCKECGLPFVVTDNRQKFCPGDQWSTASACGNRYRARQKRKRDRAK